MPLLRNVEAEAEVVAAEDAVVEICAVAEEDAVAEVMHKLKLMLWLRLML